MGNTFSLSNPADLLFDEEEDLSRRERQLLAESRLAAVLNPDRAARLRREADRLRRTRLRLVATAG